MPHRERHVPWHGQIIRPCYLEQLLVPIVDLKQRLFQQPYPTTKTVLLIDGEGRSRYGTTKILRDTYIMKRKLVPPTSTILAPPPI
jgi:hypothetical protein